jgi:hypothetical protein
VFRADRQGSSASEGKVATDPIMRTVPLPITRFKSRSQIEKGNQVAENILKLKKRALEAGMPKADAMKADRKQLDEFLADGGKKATKKVVAKKKATPAKKSTKKAPARKATAEKKPSTKKQTRKPAKRENTSDGLGRLNIEELDWTAESDEWQPRKGGPVERLFKALKRSKGNVDKAYDMLASDVYDFVGKTKRDGTKRNKQEAQAMLRYRLNRTKFEFAIRTGQHESASSENRAAYGTGDYATVRKVKPARKASTRKVSSKKVTSKAGQKKSARRKSGKK